MNPTLTDGDLVILKKWSRDFIPGDILVFKIGESQKNSQQPIQKATLIKRLIAESNSEIFIDNFKVSVNGQPYE